MFFGLETNAQNQRAIKNHWDHLNAQRVAHFKMQVNNYHAARDMYAHDAVLAGMTGLGLGLAVNQPTLELNAVATPFTQFWAEIDNQVLRSAGEVDGMEILLDLAGIQKTLPIGKTAALYTKVGDIADDVAVSIDGQAPYSFDHTDYASDGDPVPVLTAGFGVNWRHREGLQTEGIDLVLDSQEAKLRKFNIKRVDLLLNGSDKISVQGMAQQGLRNHRNASMINLGSAGANIDLTTAAPAALIEFFTTGAFAQNADANRVKNYDKLWVSPEIWRNLAKVVATDLNGTTLTSGTVLDQVKRYMGVTDIEQTFALSGNEFIAYRRSREFIQPLVGMTTGVIALPRQITQENYNFQIMAAEGLQIKKDGAGRSGVVYGADLS